MQYLLCVATHIALTTFPPIGSAASQSNYAGAIDVCPHHPPRQGKAGNPDGVQPTICTVVPFTVFYCHIYYTKHPAFLDYTLPIPPIGSGASQSSSKLSYWPLSEH